MRIFALALFFVLGAGTVAAAQTNTPPPGKPSLVRGTIENFHGKDLTIKTETGATFRAPLADKAAILSVEKRSFAQLKPTDFIGVTSVPGRNGHLRAEEIHIIPTPGIGEGSYPWHHHPGSHAAKRAGTMTNGTVTTTKAPLQSRMTNGTVTQSTMHALTVTYRGSETVNRKCVGHARPDGKGCTGTAIVDVTPQTQIVAMVPGKRADLKQGLAVVAGAMTDAQGHTVIASATVEKNGVKPPF